MRSVARKHLWRCELEWVMAWSMQAHLHAHLILKHPLFANIEWDKPLAKHISHVIWFCIFLLKHLVAFTEFNARIHYDLWNYINTFYYIMMLNKTKQNKKNFCCVMKYVLPLHTFIFSELSACVHTMCLHAEVVHPFSEHTHTQYFFFFFFYFRERAQAFLSAGTTTTQP